MYKQWYESGQLKLGGNYRFSTKIPCINCFDKLNHVPVTIAHKFAEPVGTWQEYYENGQLKSSGAYKGIHEAFSLHMDPAADRSKPEHARPGEYI